MSEFVSDGGSKLAAWTWILSGLSAPTLCGLSAYAIVDVLFIGTARFAVIN